jgi:glycopeptide antibiotics resistance protein
MEPFSMIVRLYCNGPKPSMSVNSGKLWSDTLAWPWWVRHMCRKLIVFMPVRVVFNHMVQRFPRKWFDVSI